MDISSRIHHLRYQAIINATAYYSLGENIISDTVYDEEIRELVLLQKKHPKIASENKWHEEFIQWMEDDDSETPSMFNHPLTGCDWAIEDAKLFLE